MCVYLAIINWVKSVWNCVGARFEVNLAAPPHRTAVAHLTLKLKLEIVECDGGGGGGAKVRSVQSLRGI